jgi:hypothetical protein
MSKYSIFGAGNLPNSLWRKDDDDDDTVMDFYLFRIIAL